MVVFVGTTGDKILLDVLRVIHGRLDRCVPAVALRLVLGLELVCLGVDLEGEFVLLGPLVYLSDVGLDKHRISTS